jgi:hypothetical protein
MKMQSDTTKQCVVCGNDYHPDKRTAKRQKVCDNLNCKTEYKNSYNEQWRKREENTDYFKGRYPYVQQWLKEHPHYLQNYRARKRTSPESKSDDIQVKLTDYIFNELNYINLLTDIQVELNSNINNKKNQFIKSLPTDIQVQLTNSYFES